MPGHGDRASAPRAPRLACPRRRPRRRRRMGAVAVTPVRPVLPTLPSPPPPPGRRDTAWPRALARGHGTPGGAGGRRRRAPLGASPGDAPGVGTPGARAASWALAVGGGTRVVRGCPRRGGRGDARAAAGPARAVLGVAPRGVRRGPAGAPTLDHGQPDRGHEGAPAARAAPLARWGTPLGPAARGALPCTRAPWPTRTPPADGQQRWARPGAASRGPRPAHRSAAPHSVHGAPLLRPRVPGPRRLSRPRRPQRAGGPGAAPGRPGDGRPRGMPTPPREGRGCAGCPGWGPRCGGAMVPSEQGPRWRGASARGGCRGRPCARCPWQK